jgi:hypothetical protein
LAIVLFVLLRYTDSDYHFDIFWPLLSKGQSESVYQRRTNITMAKRYQRGNQNPYIEEEQTTQWPEDIKGAIRICISKKNKQHNGQKISKGQSESVYRRRTNITMAKRYQSCLFFFDIQILIAPLISSGHCVVCSSSIY